MISGLIAPGATGKTAQRYLAFIAVATNRGDLIGMHVFQKCCVLVIGLEDDVNEMNRRIWAVGIHHGISREELGDQIICFTPPPEYKLAHLVKGSRQEGDLKRIIGAAIDKYKPDIVAIDPLVKSHSLDENDNGAMDFVASLLSDMAHTRNIAVDICQHSKKGTLAAGDADAGRGASSVRDAGRLMNTLTQMSEEEAKAFGIALDQRKLYVRLDNAKVNLAPPAKDTIWFKLVGVQIGNATPTYPNGDTIQTVERWYPPKTWEGLSSAQLNAALDDIKAGLPNGQRSSGANAAKKRAAWPIIQRHCPNRTEKQCREIVEAWIKTGLLYIENYEDPIQRKPQKGLCVDDSKRPA
jgi:hypothetical protein